jgi:hypothetical protein
MKNALLSPLLLGTLLLTAACGPEEERAEGEPSPTAQQALTQATATYDATLGVPHCATPAISCDSSTLLTGRSAWVGPEANAPNTLGGSCTDGTAGSFHYDESMDRLKVINTAGVNMAAGNTVQLQGNYWAGSAYSGDKLDLYYATNASQPVWQYLTTLTPNGSGARSFSYTFTLQSGSTTQAVRAQLRYGGAASPCDTSSAYSFYRDADDLAFTVEPAATSGITNGGFESALSGWGASGNASANTTPGLSRTGSGHVVLQPAYPTLARISQQVMIPLTAQTLQLYYRVESGTTGSLVSNLRVRIIPSMGTTFYQAFASNLTSTGAGYALYSTNISQYAGQSVRLELEAFNNFTSSTEVFRIDDVSVQ